MHPNFFHVAIINPPQSFIHPHHCRIAAFTRQQSRNNEDPISLVEFWYYMKNFHLPITLPTHSRALFSGKSAFEALIAPLFNRPRNSRSSAHLRNTAANASTSPFGTTHPHP
jgi:hypothetical protein